MPDVIVTFDPLANPQFTFAPSSQPMNGAGKVKLKRAANQTWTFESGQVENDVLHEFTCTVKANGAQLEIDDAFKDATKASYCYTVTVDCGGQQYTSPDPVIVNDPGSVPPGSKGRRGRKGTAAKKQKRPAKRGATTVAKRAAKTAGKRGAKRGAKATTKIEGKRTRKTGARRGRR